MSADSIIANPTIIAELQSVFGSGGGGITSLSSPDSNLTVAVVSPVGNISLANTINVATQVNAPTVKSTTALICSGELQAGTSAGTSGQILTSQGPASNPKWITPLAGAKIVNYTSNQCNSASGGSITLFSLALTGLTVGSQIYVNTATSVVIGGGAPIAVNFALNVDGLPSGSVYSIETLGKLVSSFVFKFAATLTSHTIEVLVDSASVTTTNQDYYSALVIEGQ